ncbi:hypothetical protein C8Q80DRAFT_232263 [Daedaleopsis nitida]|nr:hypothetical protein C8Q80DRAFT_232263 [Daedaleopsis nitida]
MQNRHQILVYSELIDTIWIKDFDVNRCAGILRAAVYDDCLYDCGTNIIKLAIYYIEDGLPYEPGHTLGRRISDYLISHPPCTLGLLDRLSALPNIREDHVHFMIGIPDHYTKLRMKDSEQLELDSSQEEGQENEEGGSSDDSATTTGSPDFHLSADTRPFDIDDARYHNTIKAAANHLPVELFSEALARFTATCKHPHSPVDAALTSAMSDLVADVQSPPTASDRVGREENLLSRLLQLVDPTSTSTIARTSHYTSLSCHFPDNSIEHDTASIDYAFYNAMRSFENDWTRNDKLKIGYCPIFGVTVVGKRLRVYGSMYYNGWVSNQLMDPYDIHPSANVDTLACIFHALSLGLTDLREWYTGVLGGSVMLRVKPAELMDAPSADVFLDSSGRKVRFGYCHPMLRSNLHVWNGDPSPDDWPNSVDSFIIKFTHDYGEDAHRLLAEAGHAPKLYYCGPPYAAFSDLDVYRPITMVVMEYSWRGRALTRGTGVPALTKQIREVVGLLHANDMVHGDLRGQNVLYEESKNRVMIIDFDWAGKEGEARYPKDLSPAVKWPHGAEPGGLITTAHDWHWMDEFFTPGTRRMR